MTIVWSIRPRGESKYLDLRDVDEGVIVDLADKVYQSKLYDRLVGKTKSKSTVASTMATSLSWRNVRLAMLL